MPYDCCGGKRRHLSGCPFAGTGPNPEKPRKRVRYCDDTWGPDNLNDKIHKLHRCLLEEAHQDKHKCICGATC